MKSRPANRPKSALYRAIGRGLALAVAALALIVVALNVTISTAASRTQQVAIALSLPFVSAEARSSAADLLDQVAASGQDIGIDDPRGVSRNLAENALEQQAADPVAARVLGQLAMERGEAENAEGFFAYADRLSRRDGRTQLYLAESALARNDFDAAVRRYSNALKAGAISSEEMLPRLLALSETEASRRALGEELGRQPQWASGVWRDYLEVSQSAEQIAGVGLIAWDSGLDNDILASETMERLIDLGGIADAAKLYRLIAPDRRTGMLLRDGDFEKLGTLTPFDWKLSARGRYSALPVPHPNGEGSVLQLDATSGSRGVVAQQVLTLSPGAYVLSGQVGQSDEDRLARPEIIVTCVESGAVLGEFVAPSAPLQGISFSEEFTVPSACAFQRIEVVFGSPATKPYTTAWLDDLSLRSR